MASHRWSLNGRVGLVTGASGGLGAHFADVLAGAGASVMLSARRVDKLEEQCERIRQRGGKCSLLQMDVRDSRSIADAGSALADIDILINNAGSVRTVPALDQSEADWDDVINTNLKGMFLVAQAGARAMRDRGVPGSIVNIASVLGLRQAAGLLPYAVSKAGVIQMTKTLALELARYGIRVNALAPGYVDTDISGDFWSTKGGEAMIARIPQRRLGRMEDFDGPLLLLASDSSSYMTGSVITVDGGHTVNTL